MEFKSPALQNQGGIMLASATQQQSWEARGENSL